MYKYHLRDVEWRAFSLSSIFNIKDGYYNKKPPVEGGTIPFLSATQYNNGISTFYRKEILFEYDKVGEKTSKDIDKRIFAANCLTITNNGSVGKVYYQTKEFTCSHDVTPIYLKNYELNSSLAKFLIPMLEQSGKSFEYAKKWRPKRMRKSKILLPADEHGNPNWHFMEEYIKERENNQRNDLKEYYKSRLLDLVTCPEVLSDVEWGEFFVSDVFGTVQRGKRLTKANQIDGETPYISSTALNNGVDNFIGNTENVRKSDHDLTIANSGSVGACFYHNYEYIASDHVTSLKLPNGNDTVYKFISVILGRLEEKYSFNREINDTRIKREKLLLPIDKNGNPNWTYMENFIKNIEQKQIKNILKYLDKYIYIYI